MSLITIDPDKCNHDGLCIQACPANLIEGTKGEIPMAVARAEDSCIRCGHCVAMCPTGALTNELLPMEAFLPMPSERPDAEAMEGLLISRRSVRAFRKEPVPREQSERLVEVARRAPTASNSQNVSWVMIEDPQRLDRIRELTLEWMATIPGRSRYLESAAKGRDVVLRGSPVLAVAHGPQTYDWTDVDCAIALTYMELQAAAMGLGTCWAGLVTMASRNTPDLHQVLGLPEGNQMGGALMLGKPRLKYYLVPSRNPARVTWL